QGERLQSSPVPFRIVPGPPLRLRVWRHVMATAMLSDSVQTRTSAIVVDLGKKRRKQIKQLREGKGKLMEEVSEAIQELKTSGQISGSAVPVVVVVRQRPRNNMRFF